MYSYIKLNIFRGKIILLLSILLALSNSLYAQIDHNKPNILFFFADDWGKYASIYGNLDQRKTLNDVIKTPNFDKLSRKGVLFTHAYAAAPSCTPSRSAVLSGQYFWRTGMGAILHDAVWPKGKYQAGFDLDKMKKLDKASFDHRIPSFPRILLNHNYHIGYSYKVWAPGSPKNAPFGGNEYKYEKAGTKFSRFSTYVTNADDPEKAKNKLLGEVEQNFEDFLSDRKKGQPFFYWSGVDNPHNFFRHPLAPGSGKKLWGIDPDSLKGKLPAFLADSAAVREHLSDYLGECEAADAALGMLVKKLKEIGEFKNTLIVVTGDHGVPGIPRAKSNLYDIGTAVNLGIRWGNKIKADRVIKDFVNLMDLAPTFLDAAGIKPPGIMDGRSLLPVLISKRSGWVDSSRTYVVTGRERHVNTARKGNLPYPQRAIRTENFLYIRNMRPDRWPIGTLWRDFRDIDHGPTKQLYIDNYNNPKFKKYWDYAFAKRPYEELYDVRTDPDAIKNVAKVPAYSAIKNKFAHVMDSILTATGDPRMFKNGSTFDQIPYTNVDLHHRMTQGQHDSRVAKQIRDKNGK